MEVIANNVANALSTRTASGGPFRRQDVLFEAVMQEQMGGSGVRRRSAAGCASRASKMISRKCRASTIRAIPTPTTTAS